jgi:peptide/nickel transport system substrate-binding protein
MKRIVCPFRVVSKSCLAIVLLLTLGAIATVSNAAASTRPKFGGTLRVQMHARIATIDPRRWPVDSEQAAATDRLASLVFDRLVHFDDHGMAQPALAISWQHDAQAKRWQFRLREGVKFSDGAPLTPEAAALALQQILGNEFDVSATSDSVVVQADHPMPDFPAQLATGRYFIFHTAMDGSLYGTGPFRVAEWPAADAPAKVVMAANESCWAGRPFVDKIEFAMDVDFEKQANAIAFGQADVVELPASQLRRAVQRGVRPTSSEPIDLLALQFEKSRPVVQDARVRQAVSLAIDRTSIADVILQRQSVAAGGLLPNWISGYAFLFPVTTNLQKAKELFHATVRELSRHSPLVLVYDFGDADARSVAERVAVNLRDVGITVQISGQAANGKTAPADIRLVRHRIAAPDPGAALTGLLNELGESPSELETPEQAYAAERAPVDAFRVIPLVHVSESYGLSPQVRDWMAPRWGGWRLEEAWLGPAASTGGRSQ